MLTKKDNSKKNNIYFKKRF